MVFLILERYKQPVAYRVTFWFFICFHISGGWSLINKVMFKIKFSKSAAFQNFSWKIRKQAVTVTSITVDWHDKDLEDKPEVTVNMLLSNGMSTFIVSTFGDYGFSGQIFTGYGVISMHSHRSNCKSWIKAISIPVDSAEHNR